MSAAVDMPAYRTFDVMFNLELAVADGFTDDNLDDWVSFNRGEFSRGDGVAQESQDVTIELGVSFGDCFQKG